MVGITFLMKKSSSKVKLDLFKKDADFKIQAAKLFLEKLPTQMPLKIEEIDHFKTEINIECFLFMSISAIDISYMKINSSLLGISNGYITEKSLQCKLKKINSKKTIKVFDILQNHITKPSHMEKSVTKAFANEYSEKFLAGSLGLDFWSKFENRKGNWFMHEWNRDKSSVWEIRKLRNQITHGSILKQSGERGTVMPRDPITLHLTNNSTKTHEMDFIYNPKEYFMKSYNKVLEMLNEINHAL